MMWCYSWPPHRHIDHIGGSNCAYVVLKPMSADHIDYVSYVAMWWKISRK